MSSQDNWTLFGGQSSGEVLPAVAGAFALMACADAEVADSEVERFVETIRSSAVFSTVDLDALEQQFRSLTSAVLNDFEQGRARALEAIGRVRGDADAAVQVIRAAQVAMVADGQLHEAEEAILRNLCIFLGLDPESY